METLEIKGKITEGEEVYLTCCEKQVDVNINDKSLHETLVNFFDEDTEAIWQDYDSKIELKKLFLRYVITDEPIKENKDFDTASAEIATGLIYSSHISGCYSEWTCGYGDFDYLINNDHSILKELNSFVGKYLYLKVSTVE